MTGQQKSLYLMPDDIEGVRRYADEMGRSFSWAARFLLRLGLREARLSTERDFQRLGEGEWKS